MGEVEILKKDIKRLSERLAFFERSFKDNQKNLIKEALNEFLNQNKKDSLKSEFDRKFRRSKREIIKQKIIETVKLKQVSLADLKYYIVDQLNYCSKASFYRYIDEMSDLIEVKDNIVYVLEVVER